MAKKAKRSAGTRAPPKPRPDPCAPIRESLAGVDAKIAENIENLQSGDFGADETKRLLRELEALNLRRQGLTIKLTACVAKHGEPKKKRKP